MSRFFFNMFEPQSYVFDPEGVVFPDLYAAKKSAVACALDMMAADVRANNLTLDSRIEVAKECGAVVFVVQFRDIVEASEIVSNQAKTVKSSSPALQIC